jgi:hypothetical protein
MCSPLATSSGPVNSVKSAIYFGLPAMESLMLAPALQQLLWAFINPSSFTVLFLHCPSMYWGPFW